MDILLIFLFAATLASCHQQPFPQQASIAAQRDAVVVKDTVVVLVKDTIVEKRYFIIQKPTPTLPTPKKPTKKVTPPPAPVKATEPKDTQYFYYKDSKTISSKITPWENSRQHTILYDPFGNETYKIEAVRSSYQISVNLHFQTNGAV